MSAHIDQTYKMTKDLFREVMADELGIAPDKIYRKRVPSLEKPHPSTGKRIKIKWEPEDSICFANEEGLYSFPGTIGNIEGVTLLGNLGLNFQTATIAYGPKTLGTALDNYMIRQRFDFDPNPHAIADWDKRTINEITFGVKDKGKAIDRMEMEVRRRELKIRHAISALQRDFKEDVKAHPALKKLSPGRIRAEAITALSRASFFGIHFDQETGIGVDYQYSIDYCRNARPHLIKPDGSLAIDGLRLEGEGEAFGTYADRKLSDNERRDAIKKSLAQIFESVRSNAADAGVGIIETDMNKAEFARSQVREATQGEPKQPEVNGTKIKEVKAEDYGRQPLRRRLTRLFDGSAEEGIVAMPTPLELRIASGLTQEDGPAALEYA